ncbi:MAG: PD-(D/E)XK nuclease family protein, partial [Rikenellaceae bacterium]|nr:PD-(D/E)XK nuclease family protein [Rikenellaceae bacterium]
EGVYGDLFAALPWDTESSASTTMVDYGGTAPARVTLEYLIEPASFEEPESASEAEATGDVRAAGAARAAGEAPHAPAHAQPFVVPLRDVAPPPKALPCSFAREGTYSYTSLEHAPLPWDELASGHAPVEVLERSGDDDATALGTAFHLLAQRAVEHMNASTHGELVPLPRDAVAACARRCALSDDQAQRLDAALDRWFSSRAARDLTAFGEASAEVPFAVRVERGGQALLLEGEIDALAVDESGHAFFVDYKTGGFAFETEGFLHAKHLLQAQCYAYALLCEGFSSVEARFVRVEQPDPACPDQPQVVTYAFDANDADALAAAIVSACPRNLEEPRP